jgi:AmiR/NasT family two-component response regulator
MSDALRTSLRGRDLVNMAKGVLMAREGVDERTAFLLLSTRAGQEGRSVRELAKSLVGAIPRRLR